MLDTRYNIGVTGKLVAETPKKLQVTGTITTWIEANKKSISRVVVPAGATGVLLNVTAVSPTGAGYLSIRPGNATGVPATSGLNFTPGDVVANSITVAVPTAGANAGQIDLYYGTPATGATMDVVADIVGYTTSTGLLDLVNRVTALETEGVAGPAGANGANGANGTNGVTGRNYGRTITSLTTVDTSGNVGDYTSITIGVDGNPIISYHDATAGALKVAACTNTTCTGVSTITTVDNTNDVGQYSSITIGADGNPIISYFDNTAGDLKVAACADPTCTAATITIVDNDNGGTGIVGYYTSITVGADNNPVISYYDVTAGDLKVAACTNATCTASTITIVDGTNNVGYYTSITIDVNGNPIISYYDLTNTDLKVAACTNATCTASTITIVDTTGYVGHYTSITIGVNSNPIISYYDFTNSALKVAACTNATCTTSTITTVDGTGNVGKYSSITIGADGNPIISYYDVTAGDLKVAKLTRTSWTPNTWES